MATPETQVGVAKIFGLIGATMTTLTGAATVTIENAEGEDKFKLDESKGQDGNVETLFASDQQFDVTIDFMPNGATRAAAASSLTNSRPVPLTKVTLSDFTAVALNGDYNYIGGWKVKLVRDKEVVCGIKLRAYLANRASLTAGAIVG